MIRTRLGANPLPIQWPIGQEGGFRGIVDLRVSSHLLIRRDGEVVQFVPFHRRAWPSRVFPGVRLPGRAGGKRVTVKNLQVVKVNEEENLIYLRGAVPGARNSYVALREAKRG